MTTTRSFQGMDPEARSSSRVLRPPGGGSSFSFGTEEDARPQSTRQNRTASNIFGPPEDSQPIARRTNPPGGKSTIFGDSEPASAQNRNPPGGKSSGIFGEAAPQKGEGDGDASENCEMEQEDGHNEREEKPQPAPAEPAAPTIVPSRRNPPGGKSSLILG